MSNESEALGASLAMQKSVQKADQEYSEAETEARREAALRAMFATPHKPHKASKVGRKESSQRK